MAKMIMAKMIASCFTSSPLTGYGTKYGTSLPAIYEVEREAIPVSTSPVPVQGTVSPEPDLSQGERLEMGLKLWEAILFWLSLPEMAMKLIVEDTELANLLFERFFYVMSYRLTVEKVDVDREGEPAFYVPFAEWLRYVRDSDLKAIVFPTKRDFQVEDVLAGIGIDYREEIREEGILLRVRCEDMNRVEYVIFVYNILNDENKREMIPLCGNGFSKEEFVRHLEAQLGLLTKYLQGAVH
ncbi:hypothetical protein L3N51_02254 [Metallosphaera sp. J1]|uniref:hypothetical protein n=1 Tax=Metallosphaera javensis (ex Hofmann et al. 2022) TaxID=99938 RepID=UPI001EDE705F|nr:hypothetical protein [Metallosphaera javensis (ex Hofmann et al. 2022)]MCG3109957.1 hypothetical protein [Metallosphaera javensis (ex Hofmann et al. 2022)]